MMKRKEIIFNHQEHSVVLPYYEYEGAVWWKHIVISGGMHGNEINGVMMCHHIREYINTHITSDQLVGKITLIPVLNTLWFQAMERYVPIDSKDLNRSFGKIENKTYSEYYADFLVEHFFRHADHAIDIHDAGGRTVLIPHTRIHSCDENECNLVIHNMAKWFDSKIVMEREWDPNMLAVYGNDVLHTPIMTIEIWGNQMLYDQCYADALRGIVNILQWLDYIAWTPILHNTIQHHLSTRVQHKTHCWGVLHLDVKLSQDIQQGEVLGSIYYPLLDQKDTIIAQQDGFVFSMRSSEQIPKDTDMISIIS